MWVKLENWYSRYFTYRSTINSKMFIIYEQEHCYEKWYIFLCHDIDGLVPERRNSIALAMELHLSCTNPLIDFEGMPKFSVIHPQLCHFDRVSLYDIWDLNILVSGDENTLSHQCRLMQICINELRHHWIRSWLVTYSMSSHYMAQCWVIVNYTLGEKKFVEFY